MIFEIRDVDGRVLLGGNNLDFLLRYPLPKGASILMFIAKGQWLVIKSHGYLKLSIEDRNHE